MEEIVHGRDCTWKLRIEKEKDRMLLQQVAEHFAMTPQQIQQESLRLYLERKLRLVESELFTLAQHFGVKTIAELDEAVQAGRFHEAETFESYFRLDYLESERDALHTLLGQL